MQSLEAMLNHENSFSEQDYRNKLNAFNYQKPKPYGQPIYNPTTGHISQAIYDPSGQMTMQDMNEGLTPAMFNAKERGAAQRESAQIRGGYQMDVQDLKNQGNLDLADTRNQGALDVAGVRGANAISVEKLRQSGISHLVTQDDGTVVGVDKNGNTTQIAGITNAVRPGRGNANVDVDQLDLKGVRAALLSVRQAQNAQLRSANGPDPQTMGELKNRENRLQKKEQELLGQMRTRAAGSKPAAGTPPAQPAASSDPLGILGGQ
jgi:hypothetical protein